MYSISGYGGMIADRVRMEAYLQALHAVMRPGMVVLDIGAGTGIFALLACRLGARHVYAIEPDNAIHVAREIAAANEFSERIEFVQDLSTRVSLPEQVDVIISDLRGVLPLFGHHIPAIADARTRFLAPGGVLIPRRDTLWAAVVETPEIYGRHTTPWADNEYGFDMQAARGIVVNSWRKARVLPEQLLVEPQCWATLDYTCIEDPNVHGEASWTATRAGMAHGLSVWFDAELTEGVGFSNAPTAPELIYGSAFFPFTEPVALAAGDTVSVAIDANLVGEDYVWSWSTRVLDQGQPGQVKTSFDQSTFYGAPLSLDYLRKRSADYRPRLNEEGQIDQFILTLMDREDQVSLREIACCAWEQFPSRFSSWQDALTRVGDLSQRYSR